MDGNLQKCVYCSKDLPLKGYFCPQCGKQNRCRECNEGLEKDANACIYCGTTVGAKSQAAAESNSQPILGSQPVMNEIEYHETRGTRSARAKFTDTVGNSVSNALIGFIGKGFKTNNFPSKFDKSSLIEDGAAEVINDSQTSGYAEEVTSRLLSPEPPFNQQPESIDLSKINKIFRFEEDRTVLTEPRLKASNKIEYVKRLTVLLAYANHLRGKDHITRKELNKLLEKYDLNYGGSRSWLASGNLLDIDEVAKTLQLNNPGFEIVPQYLQAIFDSEIKDGYLPSTAPKKRRKKKLDPNSSDSDSIDEQETDNNE